MIDFNTPFWWEDLEEFETDPDDMKGGKDYETDEDITNPKQE